MSQEARTLKVVGNNTMHCSGCETAVQFALRQVPGIETVNANYKTQEVQLSFDPEAVSLQRVKEELDWIGYEAEVVTDA